MGLHCKRTAFPVNTCTHPPCACCTLLRPAACCAVAVQPRVLPLSGAPPSHPANPRHTVNPSSTAPLQVACSSKRSCVRSFPTQQRHGLLWVLPDASERGRQLVGGGWWVGHCGEMGKDGDSGLDNMGTGGCAWHG